MATWNADVSHSGIHFSVRHMMIAKVRGTFTSWTGSIEFDEANIANSKLKAEIDVSSVDTSEPKRDGHLKSPDFFDAEKFPKITFESTNVSGSGDSFKVTGNFTLHGVTKALTLDVKHEGGGKDPWGNERQAFSAKGSLNRLDYSLGWNQILEAGGLLVGEKVEFDIEVSATKAK
jgi:polyisoprenoid-binding protein YceI